MQKLKKLTLLALFIASVIGFIMVANNASRLVITIYNSITSKHQNVQLSVGRLDAFYQQRHALVKNLLEITKEVQRFETKLIDVEKDILVQTALAKASATKMNVAIPETVNKKLEAENGLGNILVNAMDKIMVNAQHYPNINDPKMKDREVTFNSLSELRKEIVGMENNILEARNQLNESVADYNNSISLFPGNLVAKYTDYHSMNYFKTINEDSKEDPQINF